MPGPKFFHHRLDAHQGRLGLLQLRSLDRHPIFEPPCDLARLLVSLHGLVARLLDLVGDRPWASPPRDPGHLPETRGPTTTRGSETAARIQPPRADLPTCKILTDFMIEPQRYRVVDCGVTQPWNRPGSLIRGKISVALTDHSGWDRGFLGTMDRRPRPDSKLLGIKRWQATALQRGHVRGRILECGGLTTDFGTRSLLTGGSIAEIPGRARGRIEAISVAIVFRLNPGPTSDAIEGSRGGCPMGGRSRPP